MKDFDHMPGHLARRFQQIAVAVFHAEANALGFDLTPVQFAALSAIDSYPGIDQAGLAGVIAYDRTTITGVVDRLVQKGLATRQASVSDRRVRELRVTALGAKTLKEIEPAVRSAQTLMLRGLDEDEAETLLGLLRKAVEAGNDLSRAPMRAAE
ncbi:MarR family transcriptional regulator [Ciceribacter sp. L1K22]|uniref:MarR family winged helix-turn-helix transcriptional regulator n=1 Tax=Ciceribacter sp. L1K22 TaxID=2820275 RepID=UPI001ABE6C93|nr:MarR family transcriptional regulator [Ciceribacter sp. L1K22]MBO3760543.1 MarR family transcriptional regulator [Ciceribacter sp. L1K22]